jgi:flagellar assembly protein FliH
LPTLDPTRTLPYPAIERGAAAALRVPVEFQSLLPTEDRPKQNDAALALAQQTIAELEAKLASLELELPQLRERSRLEGEEAGRRKQADESSQALTQSRTLLSSALESFAADRRDYFRSVEAEAVKLALAIARKVLHREAQMDPMLLRAVVRSAMERLEETSKVTLRVPPQDAAGWKKVFAEMPAHARPSVMEDARLESGACVIESQMGTIELGVDAQLDEIERGFFDLLDQRLADRPDGLPCTNCGMEAVQ